MKWIKDLRVLETYFRFEIFGGLRSFNLKQFAIICILNFLKRKVFEVAVGKILFSWESKIQQFLLYYFFTLKA